MFNADFGNSTGYNSHSGESSRSVISNKTIKIILKKNSVVNENGVLAQAKLTKGTEYLLKYRVKFPAGFDWKGGGKLPGLAGGRSYTGCSGLVGNPNNRFAAWGAQNGDGWSSRIMWHKWFTQNNNKPFIDPYVYHKGMNVSCGDTFGKRVTIRDNTWLQVEMRVKMNTVGSSNGRLFIKIAGTTLINKTNMRWISHSSGREIDLLLWNIYRGGQSAAYKTSVDTHLYIDDVHFRKLN